MIATACAITSQATSRRAKVSSALIIFTTIRGFALSHQFNWWLLSWIRIKALRPVLATILFSI
jgi:hypothetical protein